MATKTKFTAPRVPYGYVKSSDGVFTKDVLAAFFVSKMFAKAHEGSSVYEIVRWLNSSKVLPPTKHAIVHNGLSGNFNRGSGLWTDRSVKQILANNIYTGCLIQGGDRTHAPIVSQEIFDEVQRLFTSPKTHNKTPPPDENPLRGKVICGCCGGKLQRRKRNSGSQNYNYFSCISNNRRGHGSCSGMYIRESVILQAIETVKEPVKVIVHDKEIIEVF